MKYSWVNNKFFFPILFSLILMMHVGALIIKINVESPKAIIANVENPKEKSIVVKISKNPFEGKRQIVQSEESEFKRRMDDAYLSDKDRAFDRETQARKNDVFNSGTKGGKTPKAKSKKIDLSDLALGRDDPFKKAAEDYTEAKNVKGSDSGEARLGRGVSSTNDYLADIPLGDMTNLNTTEYKFYGFYYRIRQKLEQFWGRSIQEKAVQMFQSGRRMPSSEEVITALRISLDATGEIIAIEILGTSGIKELDDAAVESFNEAGPFPNPPKDLVVNGKVTIEWGFVVKS